MSFRIANLVVLLCVSGVARAAEHWPFQPVCDVAPPSSARSPGATEIDRFLLAKLAEKNLKPVGRADKLTLIRRATFDLTGLPPAPEGIDAFLADASPDAFAKLVDRLLASPAYGERWGRHWLDVVRYADTAGETADFPAPHAWRYRNYVIGAFNADKPFDQFIREQLAGDILARALPEDAPKQEFENLITATGYLAVARRFGAIIELEQHLTIEDAIDTVGKSLLGLTVACARCHDHKHDPITVRDYYALYGIFDSTRFPHPGCEIVKRPKNMVPLTTPAEWAASVGPHARRLGELDLALATARDRLARAAQTWTSSRAEVASLLVRGEFPNGPGKHELPSRVGELSRPFSVAKGDMIRLTLLAKGDAKNDFTTVDLEITEQGGAGRKWDTAADLASDLLSGNPNNDVRGEPAVWWITGTSGGGGGGGAHTMLAAPRTDIDDKLGLDSWGDYKTGPAAIANSSEQALIVGGSIPFSGKTFFLRPPDGGGVAVTWVSPFTGSVRISGYLRDVDVQDGDGCAWVLEHVSPQPREYDDAIAAAIAAHAQALKARDAHAAAAPKVDLAYAVGEGIPHDAPIQIRGDAEKPGPIAPRRFLEVLGGHPLPPNAGSGRLQLAGWIASADNPLTARVVVNRVWQWHFGRGIVKTPSDFGTRGEPPTHPELLDWLTKRFVESGWSIKQLHRRIMLTEAYQRASGDDAEALRVDPSNDLVWRFDRRRLSAEEIRDTLLAVSGDLDRAPGGPHPFPPVEKWDYTQHAPFAQVLETNKRSVYLMVQRIKRHPFLALFDGPDPGQSTAERIDTTVPTQALFFMNDPFVFSRAESLAKRLMDLPDDAARCDRAFRLCFGRAPTPTDVEQATAFLATYQREVSDVPENERAKAAWTAYARALFGSNEMLYVD